MRDKTPPNLSVLSKIKHREELPVSHFLYFHRQIAAAAVVVAAAEAALAAVGIVVEETVLV